MNTIGRALVTLVFAVAFFAAWVLIQGPIAHGTPTMTPEPAPAPRVVMHEQVVRVAPATPSPKPSYP